MPEPIPNFVGQAEAAAPWIILAIVIVLVALGIEIWPKKPRRRP